MSDEERQDGRQPFPEAPAEHPPVVGVGASAGGLESFTKLLRNLPATTGMAYVLVQHLDPVHESHLAELLGRAAQMPVEEIRDGVALERDHVYVIPPNTSVVLWDGVLKLTPRGAPRTPVTPIDSFFSSLAEERGNRAIGVVLSGTGSDGTHGLKAIKSEGGITFAEDGGAAYTGMPRSAIDSGAVDFVLPPEGIAGELVRIGQSPYLDQHGTASEEPPDALGAVFRLLRTATRIDYANYKRTTVTRRIQRRLVLHRLETLESYLDLLRRQPAEVQALHQDLLIHVTRFFRDAEAFEALSASVFPELLRDRPSDLPIRIWVPGCATGEEVYSLAIVLMEHLGTGAAGTPVKIFATDVSETALDKARAGRYLDSIAGAVSPERLERFFSREGDGYAVSKSLRDLCVFARHDMTRDPPFSSIDLISCRNVLIYLAPVLHRRVLSLFHYALRDHGVLMLGGSEGIGQAAELFAVVDPQRKIYSKKLVPSRLSYDFTNEERTTGPLGRAPRAGAEDPGPAEVQHEVDRLLLARYAPPSVVLDEDFQITHFRGQTGAYLAPAPGTPNLNVLKMAREGLLVELRSALEEARSSGKAAHRADLRVRANGDFVAVDIRVIPVVVGRQRSFTVLFEEPPPADQPPAPADQPPPSGADAREVQALHHELIATKEYLQSIIEEHEAANEELKAANEEVVSSNEELQSTNEELLSAKEELQASNEELSTVNEEMRHRNEESTRLSDDLSNVLRSMSIPLVMVGPDLRIRRFTPAASDVFNLVPADEGRPIKDISHRLAGFDPERSVRAVQETLAGEERELRDVRGRWHKVWTRPYRTQDNKIDGAIVTVLDVDSIKRAEQQVRLQSQIAAHMSEGLALVREDSGTIEYANPALEHLLGYAAGDLAGVPIASTLAASEEERGALLAAVAESLRNGADWDRELECVRRDGATRWCHVSAAAFPEAEGGRLWVWIAADITHRKEAEKQMRNSEARLTRVLEHMPAMVAAWDEEGRPVFWNRECERVTGYRITEVLGRSGTHELFYPDAAYRQRMAEERERRGDELRVRNWELTTKGGEKRTIAWSEVSESVTIPGWSTWAVGVDVTEQKKADELRHALKGRETLLRELHHRVKNNLQAVTSLFALHAASVKDPAARALLRESENRVHAMAAIQDALGPETDISAQPLRAYVSRLCEHLFRSYGVDGSRVHLSLDVQEFPLTLDHSVAFAVLLNELVANSLRHAFPEGRNGKIHVQVRQKTGGPITLRVADDGVGLPPDLDPVATDSLGLKLVRGMARQLGGSMSVEREAGTAFSVTFPPARAGTDIQQP